MSSRLAAIAGFTSAFLLVLPADAAPPVTISAVWARPASGSGAVYATIRNAAPHPDVLVSASSPVAKLVVLRPTGTIAIPGNGVTTVAPGGNASIALIGLRRTLKAGKRFPVTLRFRDAGIISVLARVRPAAP